MAVSLKKPSAFAAMQRNGVVQARARETMTMLAAEIAFGDALYGSISESDAAIDREARRARWQRRKAQGLHR